MRQMVESHERWNTEASSSKKCMRICLFAYIFWHTFLILYICILYIWYRELNSCPFGCQAGTVPLRYIPGWFYISKTRLLFSFAFCPQTTSQGSWQWQVCLVSVRSMSWEGYRKKWCTFLNFRILVVKFAFAL